MSRRGQQDRLDKPADILLTLLVLGSVLALGGVPFWSAWAVIGLAILGGLLGMAGLPQIPTPVWVLLGLAAFSALQAAPLPFDWLTRLSPTAAETWARSRLPFGAGPPRYASLSIDPGATLLEASKLIAYAGTFLLASRVRGQRGNGWLTTLVFAAGSGVGLVTLLHGAVNATAVYGVYEPTFRVMRFGMGPLLNSNNLAGYVGVGLFAGVALLLSDRRSLPALVVAAGMSVSVCALVLSGSRGGLVATLVGAAVLALLLWRGGRFPAMAALRWAIPMGAGLALALAAGSARHLDALTSADMTRKLATWRWTRQLVGDYPWFGVGRGAFETALPPYRQPLQQDWSSSFSHAENFAIQWVADWGLLVGSAATFAIVGYVTWSWLRARSAPHRLALLTGVMVLFLQNLVDLGLELPSIAILATVALVGGGDSVVLRRTSERPLVRPLLFVWAGLGGLGWVATAVLSRFPVDVERRALAARYEALNVRSAGARDDFRAGLAAALRRHPGEPYFPLLGAIVAYHGGSENPVPWIARALERSPTNGRVHLALAEIVARAGSTAQAMLHLRLAAEYDSTLAERAGRRAAVFAPSVEVLLAAIPEGRRGSAMLMAACDAAGMTQDRVECFRRAVLRAPSDVTFRKRQLDVLLTALANADAVCAGEGAAECQAEAERSVLQLERLTPEQWQPGYYRARLLSQNGDHAEAAKLLSEVCPPGNQGNQCARDFVVAALEAKSEDLRNRAIDSYSARECGSLQSCAAANDWLASQLLRSGNAYLAFVQSSRAAEAMPSANRWLGVADLALKAHRYPEARAAISRSEVAADATPQSRARGAALTDRILRASFATRH